MAVPKARLGYRPELLYNYTPVLRPKPPLQIETVCDAPLVCVSFSEEFVPYLLGLMEIYRWKEAFSGTEEEKEKSAGLFQDLMKEFAMSCCCDGSELTVTVMTRITLDGRVEISVDGGQVWTPSPSDPIFSIPALPPPIPAGVVSTKCDAATNGKEHIEDMIAGISENLATAITVFEFAVAVAGIILEVAIALITGGIGSPAALQIAATIWAAATAAFLAGKEAFDSYWTNEVKDKILCALYCNIGENGQFSEAQYQAFLAQVVATEPPHIALNMLLSSIKAGGVTLLNNMCSYGNAAGNDCSSCSCLCNFDGWVVQFGTLVSRNNTTIVVATENIDGSWVAGIHSPNPNATCKMFQPSSDGAGSPVLTWGLSPEPFHDNFTDYPHSGIYASGTCPNAQIMYGFSGQAIGNVTFVIEGECDEA